MQPLIPKARVIKHIEANRVAISPDRKQIAYDTDEGVFMLYLATGEVTRVRKGASFPTFSPDGKNSLLFIGLWKSLLNWKLFQSRPYVSRVTLNTIPYISRGTLKKEL